MRIIFCDFDGVLNSTRFLENLICFKKPTAAEKPLVEAWPDKFWQPSWPVEKRTTQQILMGLRYLDPVAVARLDQLLVESDARLVISSDWRFIFSLTGIHALLEHAGLKNGKIRGATPLVVPGWPTEEEPPRGEYIAHFLKTHPELAADFIILDDRWDMDPFNWHLVQTSAEFGLQDDQVELALAKFQFQSDVEEEQDHPTPLPPRQGNPRPLPLRDKPRIASVALSLFDELLGRLRGWQKSGWAARKKITTIGGLRRMMPSYPTLAARDVVMRTEATPVRPAQRARVRVELQANSRDNALGLFRPPATIVLFLPSKLRIDELQQNGSFWLELLMSFVLHEATHVFDPYTTLHEEMPLAAEYFNTPSEVRAFLQQIADDVERQLRLDTSIGGTQGHEPPFSALLERYLRRSIAWNGIAAYLTEKNQRRIRLGVVRHLQDRGLIDTSGQVNETRATFLPNPVQLSGPVARAKLERFRGLAGKQVGDKIYVHRRYADLVIPKKSLKQALDLAAASMPFEPTSVLWDRRDNIVRFDEAPGFDTEQEPRVGRYVAVNLSTGAVRTGSSDAIWHHKWLWVQDDYDGFDVRKARAWSRFWSHRLPAAPKGGSQRAWEEQLASHGIPTSMVVMPSTVTAEDQTAIARKEPSLPARFALDAIMPALNVITVLDFGCGRGRDTEFFAESGYDVDGYDPTYAPYRPALGWMGYDLVTSFYVLNVLATEEERAMSLCNAAEFLAMEGHLLVVARPQAEIEAEARKSGWTAEGDGYRTGKGTFQHGMTHEELVDLASDYGLVEVPINDKVPAGMVMALFQHAGAAESPPLRPPQLTLRAANPVQGDAQGDEA